MNIAFRAAAPVSTSGALELVRDGAFLITANRRLSRSLREQYNASRAAEGAQLWASPAILPWTAWVETLWEQALYRGAFERTPVRLGSGQERFVWESIVRQASGDSLLSSEATAEAACDSRSLMHEWRLGRDEIEDKAGDDTKAWLAWCDAFDQRCAAEGWVDSARLPDRLIPLLTRLDVPGRLLLAGFDEMTPRRNEFLDACASAGVRIGAVSDPSPARGSAVLVKCRDASGELSSAASWARALAEKEPASSIGVIIPGLESRRAEVERIFTAIFHPSLVLPGASEHGRAFNISAGKRLPEFAIIRAAFLALGLHADRNDIGELGALLRSRYLGGAMQERTQRAVLDARLRRVGMTEPPLRLVLLLSEKCGCPGLARLLSAWEADRGSLPRRQRAGGWAQAFFRLLGRLGWPGDEALPSEEFQVSRQWSDLLSALAALDGVGADLSFAEALAHLRKAAAERMFQPESAPAPVQVLGPLEAAGARFDHVWIAGMDDESVPPPARPDPFIPLGVQRRHGIPHSSPERELDFSRRRLDALLASAPDAVISFAERDGERERGPSPLVLGIPESRLDMPVFESYAETVARTGAQVCCPASDLTTAPSRSRLRINTSEPRASASGVRDGALEEFEDPCGPPFACGGLQRGGSRIFQYQAQCPFRAFAELRLGAQPLETPEDGFGRRDRGTLVHAALEAVWKELKSQARLKACLPDELRAAVRSAVASAIEELKSRRAGTLPQRLAALEQRRIEDLVGEWLEIEKGRSAFTTVKPEDELAVDINGIRATVRIDRIDRLPDGRIVIIDYKTGEPKPKEWDGDRPGEPQVPLYAVALGGRIAAAVFAQLKAGKLRFLGKAEQEALTPGADTADMTELIEEWRRVLHRLAGDFRKGRAAVDPKDPTTCRTCTLAMLCRINDVELTASAIEGEGS